jgi:hypothetical protein
LKPNLAAAGLPNEVDAGAGFANHFGQAGRLEQQRLGFNRRGAALAFRLGASLGKRRTSM